MPFKSEAQRRKFHQLYREGKISKETLEKYEAETPDKPLPERNSKPGPMTKKPRRLHK